jgi:hypothetical protein
MADYSQLMNLERKQNTGTSPAKKEQKQSPNQSVSQSTNQPIDQSTTQSPDRTPLSIVEKPKAFYITKRLDHRLDDAVRYIQEKHGIKKADRSTLVNAIMDNDAQWTEEALDLLVDRVISLLTSRMMR